MAFQIYEHLVVGQLQCNCYLVGDPETNQAVVIDPGDQPDDIMAAAEGHGLRLVAVGVIHTPGHSPGSVSLLAEGDAVFSGDTLFADSIGRTDLLGGDAERELASIRERLFPLGDLPVYPGHGPRTTIDREKVTNPIVGAFSYLWRP